MLSKLALRLLLLAIAYKSCMLAIDVSYALFAADTEQDTQGSVGRGTGKWWVQVLKGAGKQLVHMFEALLNQIVLRIFGARLPSMTFVRKYL